MEANANKFDFQRRKMLEDIEERLGKILDDCGFIVERYVEPPDDINAYPKVKITLKDKTIYEGTVKIIDGNVIIEQVF